MATPSVIEKCRRGRPNEPKRQSWMTLGYGSFGDCISQESNTPLGRLYSRVSKQEWELPQQVCGHVRYAFKTSDRLYDSYRAMNLTGVDEQLEKELELVTDTLQKATTKCDMMGPDE